MIPRDWTAGLLEVFFPPSCVACDEVLPAPGFFCEACAPLVEELPAVACGSCGEPGRFPGDRCPRCERRLPPFTGAYAPFEHDGALARAIHRYKYEDHPELARPLGGLLAATSRDFLARAPGALCPIPLHVQRFRERKYDQATLLAVELAKATGRALEDGWLTRARATERQVGLTDAQREQNVRGAFTADPRAAGHEVVLVDDVLTTGATAREAAQALLDVGATRVVVLTLARAPRESLGQDPGHGR